MKQTKTETMRAVRYYMLGGPEVLQLEHATAPEPAAGQVLVRVKAAGINPVDWKLREGWMPGGRAPHFPVVPGSDVAGVVSALGPDVTDFKVGDEVYGAVGTGAYADYLVANARLLALKPKRISFCQAAALPVAAMTAWQAIFDHAGLAKDQTILIHGAAGGVGSFAVQLAKWRRAKVIATASAEHRDFLEELGVDTIIDYKAIQFEEVAREVDVVLDTQGGDVQERSWGVLKQGGILISLVQPPSREQAEAHGARGGMCLMEPSRALLDEIAGLVDAGTLSVYLDQVFPLEEAGKAQELSHGHHARGKIVLDLES